MTPLAHRIVKELTLPVKGRTFVDGTGLVARMDDIHCFDVTEVWQILEALRKDGFGAGYFDDRTAFAPAPKFWIERAAPDGLRFAWHAESLDADDLAGWFRFRCAGMLPSGTMGTTGEAFDIRLSDFSARLPAGDEYPAYVGMIYAALAVINTPRLIGRKQHMPHRGLERRLANAKGLVGKFPLHAWTELKLSVSAMMRRADGTVHEAHYTGEKCLHFCRSHIRVKGGRLELVRAHWRGNPALGIKRTRYKLAA